MKNTLLRIFLVLLFSTSLTTYGASFPKAEMLNDNGLIKEAKTELIDVLFSTAPEAEKAKSLYLLGSISFTEKKVSTALTTWRQLLTKYPTSKEAILVKDKIKELAEIVGEAERESIQNSVAQSYIEHGDFWSKGKDYKFTIDTSWIPNVDSAIVWYDKVIKDFPNSSASRVAYQEKMRTLLGWKEVGRDGETHGVKNDFYKYMPQLLETFRSFEKDHPNAATLQAFRYQIAQVYWGKKDWVKTREWLNLVITTAGESDSFYKETAKSRLKKIEY